MPSLRLSKLHNWLKYPGPFPCANFDPNQVKMMPIGCDLQTKRTQVPTPKTLPNLADTSRHMARPLVPERIQLGQTQPSSCQINSEPGIVVCEYEKQMCFALF